MTGLPERLRRAVAADHRPVRPLPPARVRSLEVALWGVLAAVGVPAVFGLRQDAAALGWLAMWGAAGLECAAGLLLVGLALREAIPGSGASRTRRLAALAAGFAVQAAVALLTWMHGPGSAGVEAARHDGAACSAMQGALALPALTIAAFLLVRGLPVRPPWAGALAGLAAALVADGVWHLVCPVSDLRHLLVWHGGATVTMVLAGTALGLLWQRRESGRLAASP